MSTELKGMQSMNAMFMRGLFLHGSLLTGAVLLAACSGGGGADTSGAAPTQAAQVSGQVMGGRQPVVGSTVTLYAVGSSGYGAATALSPTATTGSNGSWNISFNCPAAGTQIYAVVSGGNAGGGVNNNLALSAVLGPCGDSSSPLPTNANITEVTTVASAYALAQFLDSSGKLPGAPASNATGLANAISVLANLVSVTSGDAQTTLVTGASGTPPAATLNTLANLLATCVNTTGGSAGDGSACGKLFTAATPAGGTAPTTTLQAALNIALNPGNNATALYNLTSASGPYQTPAPLAAAPNDWTLVINYNVTNMTVPGGANSIAFDSKGNPWLAAQNTPNNVNGGNGATIELSPQGVTQGVFDGSGKMNNPTSIAVDTSGNVWLTNADNNVISLSSSGVSLSGSPFSSGQMAGPSQIATDAMGNVWMYDSVDISPPYFTELAKKGSGGYTGTDYLAYTDLETLANSTQLEGLALDGSGDIWVISLAGLAEFDSTGTQIGLTFPLAANLIFPPNDIAIDPSNNVWILFINGTAQKFVGSYNGPRLESGYSNSNLNPNGQFAIDGVGSLWIPNVAPAGVMVMSNSGTSISGASASGVYAGSVFSSSIDSSPGAIAIDASGNVWVGDGIDGNLYELVGAATPVKTPLIGAPRSP
jgi:hypothetical protein